MVADYTLVVGTKSWSSWSLRPYVALRATGAAFDEIVVPLRREPETASEISKYSPSGKVPALNVTHDRGRFTVWDSLAICETLAERHPEAGLWPDDWAARARARSYAAEMHSGFADLRDQLPMDFARRKALPALRETTQSQIARVIAMWSEALASHGDGFLFGRLSVADCMFAPVVSRFVTYGTALPAPLQDYVARMMALPAMVDWGRAAQSEVDAGLG